MRYLLACLLTACATIPPAPVFSRIDDVREALCHEPSEAIVVECLMAAQSLDTYQNLPTLRNAEAVVQRLDLLVNAACNGKETPTCQKLVQALSDLNALVGLVSP